MNKLIASMPFLTLLFCLIFSSGLVAQVFVYRGMLEDQNAIAGRAYKEIQTADFNEDGCPDLYLAQKQSLSGSGQVVEGDNIDRVLINTCNGTIGDPSSLLQVRPQTGPFNTFKTVRGYDVEVADMDGDNNLDIVRPDDARRIDILWGDGNGNFPQVTRVLSISNDPNNNGRYDNVSLSDLDNDGDLDIIAAQYNFDSSDGMENVILRNRQKQNFQRLFDIESGELPADSTHTVSSARFDNDKLPEALIGNVGNSKLYRNDGIAGNGTLQFSEMATLTQPALDPSLLTTAAEFFDLNRDRKLDIYIGKFARSSQIPFGQSQHAAYFGDGSGGFSSIKILPVGIGVPPVYDVRFADLDGDKNIEIIRVNALSGTESSTLQAISITRGTTAYTDVSEAFFAGEWFGELALELADLDQDGDLDLITGGTTESDTNGGNVNNGHSAIHIYENTTLTPILFVASYVPQLGQPRTTSISTSDNPDEFEFAFDPNLGKFVERPGTVCQTAVENPTYLKLSLAGAILNQGGIDACTFHASWDAGGTPIPCSSQLVAELNAGDEFIINTDDYLSDPVNCDEFNPLQPHVLFNEPHWLRATFTVDGVEHVRRALFRQNTQSLRVSANADTYVSQAQPTSNFGSLNFVEVGDTSTGGGAFGFWRFAVPPFNGTLESARVQLKPLTAISHLNLHQVCGNGWNEFTMDWNDWFNQTGGSCGVIDTLNNMAADRPALFNVESFVNSAGTYTVGGESFDTLTFRRFGSRSAGVATNRPVLKITLQR